MLTCGAEGCSEFFLDSPAARAAMGPGRVDPAPLAGCTVCAPGYVCPVCCVAASSRQRVHMGARERPPIGAFAILWILFLLHCAAHGGCRTEVA